MKYYVISGEPSGDLHGSKLMRGIAACDADAKFRFCGGDRMANIAGKDAMLYIGRKRVSEHGTDILFAWRGDVASHALRS